MDSTEPSISGCNLTFTITWILTGNKEQVAKINKNIVELASFRQKLFRFGDYLKFDYLKYYK
jgi:hypothetical protein